MRTAALTAIVALSALTGGETAVAARPETPVHAQFLHLDEISIPIFGGDRIEGELSATLMIEARDNDAANALKMKLPELRSAALAAMLEFARLRASGFTPVDAKRLSADLNGALKRAYPRIVRVLIIKVQAVPA
ncbi:MAG TPA: hypothetical protein VNZ43_10365 [Sphingomonadaceae bacterium]|nr:hypothetical protein [Sphingomonadaceae bacterium]